MTIIGLLVAFQLKHFFADYLFQNEYMLGKFKAGWDFFMPLLAHVAVHAGFTFMITGAIVGFWPGLLLALFDGVTHFVVDRIKAGPKYFGYLRPSQPEYWWVLGGDQMLHHLVHYTIIGVITILLANG